MSELKSPNQAKEVNARTCITFVWYKETCRIRSIITRIGLHLNLDPPIYADGHDMSCRASGISVEPSDL
jgi:hypothetical protein